jgi:hypothetical protein
VRVINTSTETCPCAGRNKDCNLCGGLGVTTNRCGCGNKKCKTCRGRCVCGIKDCNRCAKRQKQESRGRGSKESGSTSVKQSKITSKPTIHEDAIPSTVVPAHPVVSLPKSHEKSLKQQRRKQQRRKQSQEHQSQEHQRRKRQIQKDKLSALKPKPKTGEAVKYISTPRKGETYICTISSANYTARVESLTFIYENHEEEVRHRIKGSITRPRSGLKELVAGNEIVVRCTRARNYHGKAKNSSSYTFEEVKNNNNNPASN